LYDEVIKIYHHLVDRKGLADLTAELALAHESKADLLQRQRRSQEAVDVCDKAIAIWESLVQCDACVAYPGRLAAASARKAEVLRSLGDPIAVANLCRQTIAALGPLSKQPVIHLAAAHSTDAHNCHAMRDDAGAVLAADRALAICRQLAQRLNKTREVRHQVGELLEKVAVIEGQQQVLSPRARHRNFDQAIALLERMVHAEGLVELAGDLARAIHSKELDLANEDQRPPAAALPEVCSTLVELLRQQGRGGLAHRLFAAYEVPAHSFAGKEPAAPFDRYVFHFERLMPGVDEAELHACQAEALLAKSLALSRSGDDRGALAAGQQALAFLTRLARMEERSEYAQPQAAAHAVLARLLAGAGEQEKACSQYDQAIAGYEQLIEQEGRNDLVADVAALKESRALLGDRGLS
jgi:tetratricopeptide (TPR) repeat protein